MRCQQNKGERVQDITSYNFPLVMPAHFMCYGFLNKRLYTFGEFNTLHHLLGSMVHFEVLKDDGFDSLKLMGHF